MKWKVDFSRTAEKQFSKLDHTSKSRIIDYLKTRIIATEDPRCFGNLSLGSLAAAGDIEWVITV